MESAGVVIGCNENLIDAVRKDDLFYAITMMHTHQFGAALVALAMLCRVKVAVVVSGLTSQGGPGGPGRSMASA